MNDESDMVWREGRVGERLRGGRGLLRAVVLVFVVVVLLGVGMRWWLFRPVKIAPVNSPAAGWTRADEEAVERMVNAAVRGNRKRRDNGFRMFAMQMGYRALLGVPISQSEVLKFCGPPDQCVPRAGGTDSHWLYYHDGDRNDGAVDYVMIVFKPHGDVSTVGVEGGVREKDVKIQAFPSTVPAVPTTAEWVGFFRKLYGNQRPHPEVVDAAVRNR